MTSKLQAGLTAARLGGLPGSSSSESAMVVVDDPQRVSLLHRRAILDIGLAAAELESGRGVQMWILLVRAQTVLDELESSLGTNRSTSPERCGRVYRSCKRRLVEAGMQGDPTRLLNVSRLLGELGESGKHSVASSSVS